MTAPQLCRSHLHFQSEHYLVSINDAGSAPLGRVVVLCCACVFGDFVVALAARSHSHFEIENGLVLFYDTGLHLLVG